MNIKNYTSGVAIETTIGRINSKLAAAGAAGITTLYDERKLVKAIIFHIDVNGKQISIRVPANVEACFQAMWKDHCLHHSRPREETKSRIRDQAQRTAWKLVQDWIDVQISMIVMRQAEFLEVFLPYVWDGRQTLFESAKGGGFKMLPEKTD